MTMQFNSASRILSIMQLALQYNDSLPVVEVWRKVFGIEAEDVTKSYLVAAKLAIAYDEVNALEGQLRREQIIGESLFLPAMKQALEVFSPLRLSSNFSSVRSQITAEHFRTFQMLVGILRAQEVQATSEEILELYSLIADLQEMVSAARLSPELTALVQRHIETLRHALGNYAISGARSINEALRSMSLEMLPVEAEVLANVSTEELTLLKKIWQKAEAFAGVAGTVTELYGAVQLAWPAATTVAAVALAVASR